MTKKEEEVPEGDDAEYIILSETLVGDGKELDAWLRETGFRTTRIPSEFEPAVPKNLNAMAPDKLGNLFDQFGEWFDFLIREEAMISNELAKAKHIERLTKRYVIERKIPGPVTQREGKALLDRDVVFTMAAVARIQEKQRILSARIDSIQGTLRRISRHIALRDPSADLWLRSQSLNAGRARYDAGPAPTGSGETEKGRPTWGTGGLRPPVRAPDDE